MSHLSPLPDPAPLTSPTLLDKVRSRADQASWRRFHQTYAKLLERYAIGAGLAATDAEDLAQELMIELVERMPSFRYAPQQCSFKNWLWLTVQRRVIDRCRRRKYVHLGEHVDRTEPLTGQLHDSLAGDASELERLWQQEWETHLIQEAARQIKDAVRPDHYQIFFLNVLRGIPASDTAARCGVSLMTVYLVRLRLGRRVQAALREIERRGAV